MNAMHHGTERRRHRMYLTHNTEYHLRDDRCVAVRNRLTGEWLPEHSVIGRRVFGLPPRAGGPLPGDRLCFEGEPQTELIVTGAIQRVDRPPREAVSHYA